MAQYFKDTIDTAEDESNPIDWPGGPGVFAVQGTFAGATFQLQFSLDGSTWSNVPGAELTIIADDIGAFQLPPCKLRVQWAGGGQDMEETLVQVLVAPSYAGWWNDPTNLPGT
jgi:hypothetical protein